MKLFVDQCVVRSIRDPIVDAGYDVVWAGCVHSGQSDDVLIGIAHAEDRLLVTVDKDFGDWVVRKGLATRGIIFVRLDSFAGPTRQVGHRIVEVLQDKSDTCRGIITVIEASRVRTRRLKAPPP